jgi:uncharacterized protein
MKINLGKDTEGREIDLDLDTLIRTRMLLQAASGGGKSWAIRRLLEQTHGRVQQIVLDPEGEFSTLREKYDYVVVGKGGDVSADPRHAALLARRLMELGVSAIIDLFEMTPKERREFVHVFLDALVDLPKNLWHPCIVILDEAHDFAPEKGESEALESVVGLAGRGRKRGYCAVLATGRIARLNKDATANLRNRFIGLAVEDIDRKRAAEEIGIGDKKEILALRDLDHEFFALGPALRQRGERVRDRIKIQFGPVQTSHPDIGRKAAPPPPPREKVKAVLSKMADLPKEAAEEAQTVAALKAQLREAKRELRARPTVEKIVEKPVISRIRETKAPRVVRVPVLTEKQVKRLESAARKIAALGDHITESGKAIGDAVHRAVVQVQKAQERTEIRVVAPAPIGPFLPHRHPPIVVTQRPRENGDKPVGLIEGERKILIAVAQHAERGVTQEQIAVLTGYKATSRRTYLQSLAQRGYIQKRGGRIYATEEGIAALGSSYEPLPVGDDLRRYWLGRLPEGEKRLFTVFVEVHPHAVTHEELAEKTGYKPTSIRTYLQKLRARELVEGMQASETLFT